jgi:hypothetical protein
MTGWSDEEQVASVVRDLFPDNLPRLISGALKERGKVIIQAVWVVKHGGAIRIDPLYWLE